MAKKKVHFMGIGGSGVSAVVQLAHHQGFDISGCDQQTDTPYIEKVKKDGIKVYTGHDSTHLDNIDILAASPAAFFQKPLHPELALAVKKNIAMTWQKFLGLYLHKNKFVICIAGTHGKSTTTAMCSLLFEDADLDPSVMIGATIPRWNNNARSGNGKYFITESDEFFDNFLNYSPDIIVLNNIEPDHPDYFKSQKQLYESFSKHLLNLTNKKLLIFNQDSPGIKRLFKLLPQNFFKTTKLIGYSLNQKPLIPSHTSITAVTTKRDPTGTTFTISSTHFKLKNENFTLPVPGDFNVSNALGVITLALTQNIPLETIKSSLSNFSGIGRRLELLGTPNNITIYDDYAHHPTAVKLTLAALKQRHPNQRIYCVVEPHSFSRTKQLLTWYKGAFDDASKVIIAPIFQARDTHDHHISTQDVVNVSKHKNITSISNFNDITATLKQELKPNDIVIVMGAGKSYQLSRQILNSLS